MKKPPNKRRALKNKKAKRVSANPLQGGMRRPRAGYADQPDFGATLAAAACMSALRGRS